MLPLCTRQRYGETCWMNSLEDPKSNALILLNGKEISVLNGLQTKVKDGDEVVFVPVVHGG